MPFPVLGTRLLPIAEGGGFELHPSSPCPTMDVAMLTSARHANLSLWRVGSGPTGKIWEQAVKDGPTEAFAWSPDGQYISELHTDRLCLRSVHTGAEVNHTLISRSSTDQHPYKRRRITSHNWHELASPSQPIKKTHAQDLIEHLPALPTKIITRSDQGTISTKDKKPNHNFAEAFATTAITNLPVPTQREESKLSVYHVYPTFPSLPPSPTEHSTSTSQTQDVSLLITAEEEEGKALLFLGGTLSLGSLTIAKGATLLSSDILPSGSDGTTSLALLYRTNKGTDRLQYATYTFALPTHSLSLIAKVSTELRGLLEGVYERLREGNRLWDEMESARTKWLERLESLIGAHGSGGQSVSRQLMNMLLTGRPSHGVKEHLASKLTERSLSKWEQTVIAATSYLRAASYQSIVPQLERIILWLEEIRGWAMCGSEMLEGFSFDVAKVEQSIEKAQKTLVAATHLEEVASNEERAFIEFSKWMKYEMELIAAKDASTDSKISSTHDPISVSRFLQSDLKLEETSTLLCSDPSRNFEMLSILQQNQKTELDLDHVMSVIRQKQHLPSPEAHEKKLENLPDLMRQLTSLLGHSLERALSNILDAVEADDMTQIGTFEAGQLVDQNVHMRATENGQTIICVHTGGKTAQDLSPSLLWICSINREHHVQLVSYPTFTLETDKFSVLDFGFFDDDEIAILGQSQRREKGSKYFIGTLKYSQIEWPEDSATDKINATTPLNANKFTFARHHPLDPALTPLQLALNGRRGRRIGCVLGNEQRQLEFYDMEEQEPDDEEEEGGSMDEE